MAIEVLIVVLVLIALISAALSFTAYLRRMRKARDKAVILRRVADLEGHRRSE